MLTKHINRTIINKLLPKLNLFQCRRIIGNTLSQNRMYAVLNERKAETDSKP